MLSRLISRRVLQRNLTSARLFSSAASGEEGALRSKLHGTDLEQSFRQAFVNECVASIRYEYFADQADLDGLTTLADMFRSVARSEKKQAMELYNLYVSETGVDPINQLKVESSEDMLEAARQIEAQDADVFYPTLVSMANTEPDCEWLGEHFSRFADAEARHKEGVEYCYESLFPEEEDSEIEQ